MTSRDDPPDEMARSLSAADAERVLSGDLGAGDLPAETAELARFMDAMRAPGAPEDPAVEQRVISRIASAIRDSDSSRPAVLSRVRSRRISTKAAAAAFVAVIVSGTAAAAATGSLPAGVQRVVSDALSHVNISVPHPNQHPKVDPQGRKPGDGSPPANSQAPTRIGEVNRSTTTAGGASTATPGSKTHTKTTAGARHGPPTSNPGKAQGLTTKTTPPAAGNGNGNNGNGNGNGPPASNPGKAKGLTTKTTPPAAGNGNGKGNGKG